MLSTLFCLLTFSLFAQTSNIFGTVQDVDGTAIEGVEVQIEGTNYTTLTDNMGYFELGNLVSGSYTVIFNKSQWKIYRIKVDINSQVDNTNAGTIVMSTEDGVGDLSSEDLIPSITLSDSDVNDGGGASNVSGLLTASRDVFFNAAAFAFGFTRFSIRGYDSEFSSVYINGLSMNSLENGRAVWSLWGGLNDAMRNREVTVGLAPTDYTFGGPGGATQIDMRASTQWKQLRVGMSVSNRSYIMRPMAIYSTGLMKNGWAFSASGSWRHANQAQIPGSYYSAASYYAAAEKRIGENHALNLSVFGAPRVRASNGPVTDEQMDIAREATGKKGYFYNPYWGYQTSEDGTKQEIRNARQSQMHVPVFMLTHDWKINEQSKLSTSLGYQFGRNGSSAINWFTAADPRPEYYRKWPSYFALTDTAVANQLHDYLVANPDLLQLNWDALYEANRNGEPDSEFSNTEKKAKYFVEERRYDVKQYSFNTLYRNFVSEHLTLNAGLRGQYSITHNFKVMEDLLGADYHVDINQFAARDSVGNTNFAQNDLDNPNAIIRKGDVFGWNYKSHVQNIAAWAQGQFRFGKVEFFAAGEVGYNRFWREGLMRNGRFPDNSLGKGKVHNYINYNFKGGATYKIDGRNYIFANANYGTRAPYFRDAYVSPAFRDQLADSIQSTTIFGGEVGYILSAPKAKIRIAGYYTQFLHDYYNKNFYSENATAQDDGTLQTGFVNFIMTDVNRRHMGLELAGQYEVLPGLKLTAVAAIGEFIYTNRPTIRVFLDNDPNTEVSSRVAYMKNAYVAGSPQMAYNFGINYNSPKYWFLNVNFNYTMRNFVDINPDRRTIEAVALTTNPQYNQQFVEQGSDQWNNILAQEELPAAFTIDVFGGKSFRFKAENGKASFVYINIGINNILNNRNIKTGGFEQLRYDFAENNPNKFPTRYYYGLGINYFASVVYRLPM